MTLTIIPAIDIIQDQVVRLHQGRFEDRTVYGHDPVDAARRWEDEGAEWLHVVDLDAAQRPDGQNSRSIQAIIAAVNIPVQVGGGIRTIESIDRWVESGAQRVVLGTKALDRDFLAEAVGRFGDKVIAAIDARQGVVAVEGWQRSTEGLVQVLKQVSQSGVSRILFTDIDRDGTLLGPDVEKVRQVLEAVDAPVIASGGVGTEQGVYQLAKLVGEGLEGIVIGKALYSGTITLEAAKRAATDAG